MPYDLRYFYLNTIMTTHGSLHSYNASQTALKFYRAYMEMEGNGAEECVKIIDEPDRHIYFKSAYTMHLSATLLVSLHPHCHQAPELLQSK